MEGKNTGHAFCAELLPLTTAADTSGSCCGSGEDKSHASSCFELVRFRGYCSPVAPGSSVMVGGQLALELEQLLWLLAVGLTHYL